MDENLFHYHLSNQKYENLLREAQQARLAARVQRALRMREGAYPHWMAVILAKLSRLLIAAGQRLQADLEKAGSLPLEPGEQTHQYSYGD